MTDLKDGIERNVAQTAVWSKLRISSFIHHYRDRDVRIEGLELRHDGTDGSILLDNANLNLLHGHVYGIVGRNGVGKTTLMRHIAEHRILGLPSHLRCVYIDDESHQIGMASASVLGGPLSQTEHIAGGQEEEEEEEVEKGEEKGGMTALAYLLSQHKAQIAAQRALRDALEDGGGGADGGELDVDAIQAACDTLAALEADKAEARASQVLVSLGIDPLTPLSALSGGWLHRASLAAALFVESDILLLDEPTNHLDIHGIAWLEQYLQSQCDDPLVSLSDDAEKGAKSAKKGPSSSPSAGGSSAARRLRNGGKNPIVLVISHDFNFLDNVCTDIVSYEGAHSLAEFKGNYSRFLETRQAKLAKHERMYKAQEKRRRTLTATIEKLQQKAVANPTLDLGGQIRARQQTLKHRLGASLDGTYWKYGLMGPRPEILAPPEEEPISFALSTDVSDVPEGSGKGETVLVRIKNGAFRYGAAAAASQQEKSYAEDGTPIPPPSTSSGSMFPEPLNISVTLSSRIALVGRNGSGKSTILRLLAGELALTEGERVAWAGLRTAFLSQHSITAARSGPLGALTPIAFVLSQHEGGRGGGGGGGGGGAAEPYASSALLRSEALRLLQSFGIAGVLAEVSTMGVLSAGQRARVLLANALLSKPHVLFLDEPTSHLDAETSSALSIALEAFDGAVVVASHDVTFIENLGGSLFCTDAAAAGDDADARSTKDKALCGAPCFGWYSHPVSTYHSQLLHEKRAIDRQLALAGSGAAPPSPSPSAAAASASKKVSPPEEGNAAPTSEEKAKRSGDEGNPSSSAKDSGAKPKTGLGCRYCGGAHFSHSCPDRPEGEAKGAAMPDNYEANGWRFKNQPPPKSAAKAPVPLPKLVEKASDGQGDWKVAVSKSALKRIKKGL